MIWIFSLIFVLISASSQNINHNTSRGVYGTELLLLEASSAYRTSSYRFEDFFWTGSGDGDEDDYLFSTTSTPIYQTKTVTSTVYLDSSTPNTTKCNLNCEPTVTPTEEIAPTPTQDEEQDADRQFWLLTVLKGDGIDPVIIDLKNSLAKLYKTAFQRQQEKHLGIRASRKKRAADKPVRVYIHGVEKTKLNGEDKVQVLYHVAVAGKPVDAVTAAQDMALISDEEVQNELGYPFLIKAEPYLKAAQPEGLSRQNNTWIFIGVSIITLLVILLMIALLTLGMTKRKRPSSALMAENNRRQIFEQGVNNGGFEAEKEQSPTYINFRRQAVSGRPQSSLSSDSSSLNISPLMTLKKHTTPPRKPARPKAAAANKRIAPELLDSDSSTSKHHRDSPDTFYIENYDPGVVSPKSYLSMPSVKSFPRGAMPEPLNKVLEPVSVLHLDIPEDTPRSQTHLLRHGSVGAVADPGIIGPVVWNMHCQRLQHGVSVDEGIDDLKVASNVSRMRKRFHNLLDDTFSLFGSRRESPEQRPAPIQVKSHSAVPNERSEEPLVKPRPKTSDFRRVVQSPSAPRGAWGSSAPSPLIRPLSADVMRKQRVDVNVEHILAEGKFRPNDPAVPLIAAIKQEIQRCALPGSTSDLRK